MSRRDGVRSSRVSSGFSTGSGRHSATAATPTARPPPPSPSCSARWPTSSKLGSSAARAELARAGIRRQVEEGRRRPELARDCSPVSKPGDVSGVGEPGSAAEVRRPPRAVRRADQHQDDPGDQRARWRPRVRASGLSGRAMPTKPPITHASWSVVSLRAKALVRTRSWHVALDRRVERELGQRLRQAGGEAEQGERDHAVEQRGQQHHDRVGEQGEDDGDARG